MPLSSGTRLGPYEILSPLGAGGMGEVYKARDTRLGRDVAIKVLPEEFAKDPERIRRFEGEARAASALSDPHIVTVFDVGSARGSNFFATELVDGSDLRHMLDSGAFPPRKALELSSQIASGLAAAHEKGIIHRDLKPENILITKSGLAKIADFGLAKLTEASEGKLSALPTSDGHQTTAGVVMGTVAYMSPEQARGNSVDSRSDQFAFGSIVYEMLTGNSPFRRASPAETISAILRDDPQPLPASLPAPVRWIVERCLAKEPENRYASTVDLSRDLAIVRERASEVTAVLAKPAPEMRGRGWVWPVGVAVAAIAAFLIGSLRGERRVPVYHQLTFRRGTVYTARFTPDPESILYSASWEGDPITLYSVRPRFPDSRPLGLPSAHVLAVAANGEMTIALGPRPNGEGTFEGTLARTQISGGTPREIQEGIRGADCTPDERSCAFVRQVAGQFRLEFPEGNVLYRTGGYISSPRISPDGTRVAFFDHPAVADDSGTVAVADLHGHVRTLTPEWASQDGLAWSADGREIWFTAGEEGPSGSLYAVSLSGRLRVVERTAGGLTLHDIARDGRVLLSRTNRRYGILLDAPDATTREPDLGWFEASISEDISPDGKTLLFTEWGQAAGANYAACLRRLDGSGPVRLGSGAIAALSPDGKTALSVDRHPPSALLLLPTRAGEPKRIADASMTYQTSPGWLPDGHRVVFCGNEKGRGVRVYVQDLQGGPARPISPEGFDIREGAHPISPDGERIAVFDSDQKVFLLPTRGGTPTPLPELDGYEPIRWTQDGQALLAIEPGELPAKVYRLNVAARTKELARKLMPSDAAGLTDVFGVEVTPDERTYVYTYSRILSDLFIVEGLR